MFSRRRSRADRQPEFTQIDCETTFLNELEIRAVFEEMISTAFLKVSNVELEGLLKFSHIKKPLKILVLISQTCELISRYVISEIVKNIEFKIFADAAGLVGRLVYCVYLEEKNFLEKIDDLTEYVKIWSKRLSVDKNQ